MPHRLPSPLTLDPFPPYEGEGKKILDGTGFYLPPIGGKASRSDGRGLGG